MSRWVWVFMLLMYVVRLLLSCVSLITEFQQLNNRFLLSYNIRLNMSGLSHLLFLWLLLRSTMIYPKSEVVRSRGRWICQLDSVFMLEEMPILPLFTNNWISWTLVFKVDWKTSVLYLCFTVFKHSTYVEVLLYIRNMDFWNYLHVFLTLQVTLSWILGIWHTQWCWSLQRLYHLVLVWLYLCQSLYCMDDFLIIRYVLYCLILFFNHCIFTRNEDCGFNLLD